MNSTLLYMGLVVLFVLIGGVFAAAEMALVSLRDSQAKALAGRSKRGRIVAELNQDPNRFLSAVQVGVTVAGFLSAAFGGATLSGDLAPVLERWGLSQGAASIVALVLVTIAISYLSLVFGELAPKRLALQRAEAIALGLGPMVDRIARFSRPVIWLLSASTDIVVRIAGGDPHAQKEQISDEELRELVNAHDSLGEEERRIVEDVFEAGDRQIREVMIPRTEVDFLDASMPVYKAARLAISQPHSRYPVIRGSADDVIGFVHVRDLLDPEMASRSVRVGELGRPALTLPWTREILAALADMRREGTHLAIVADEYGGTAGIVTMEDLVEELIGDIRDEYDADEVETLRHRGGDVEVDGLLNLDDFEDETGLELPDGPYETVAGFIMAQLGRLPVVNDEVNFAGRRIVVRETDGRRVGRVLVTMTPAGPAGLTGLGGLSGDDSGVEAAEGSESSEPPAAKGSPEGTAPSQAWLPAERLGQRRGLESGIAPGIRRTIRAGSRSDEPETSPTSWTRTPSLPCAWCPPAFSLLSLPSRPGWSGCDAPTAGIGEAAFSLLDDLGAGAGAADWIRTAETLSMRMTACSCSSLRSTTPCPSTAITWPASHCPSTSTCTPTLLACARFSAVPIV